MPTEDIEALDRDDSLPLKRGHRSLDPKNTTCPETTGRASGRY